MAQAKILTADLGGTHSRFAIFEAESLHAPAGLTLLKEVWLPTQEHSSFISLIDTLRAHPDFPPLDNLSAASFAATGPVENGASTATNVSWSCSEAEISNVFGVKKAYLLNDFSALGYGCLFASKHPTKGLGISTIYAGAPKTGACTAALIGAGTGLGKAILLQNDESVIPSEGGHALFPFNGADEFDYACYLRTCLEQNEISMEHVLSGSGLACLYSYHAGNKFSVQEAVANIYSNPESDAATATMTMYARFYARACKCFIFETLPIAGVYIGGGMAGRVPVLQNPVFLLTLHNNSVHANLLRSIPIYHIENQSLGLWGAAYYTFK